MNLQIQSNKAHFRRRPMQRTISFLPKYGQIYVSHALCEDFHLTDEVFIVFGRDDDSGDWFFTLTDNAAAGGFRLRKQSPTKRCTSKQHGGKQEYHKNALMCIRRTFVRQITQDCGTETLKCPVSVKPKMIDGVMWYRLIKNINLPVAHE